MADETIEITLVTKQAENSLNNLGNAAKKTEEKTKSSFDKMSLAWSSFVGNLASDFVVGVFNKISNAVLDASKEFFDFSQEMTRINALLPANAKLTEDQKNKMVELARAYGTDATAQAKTYFTIITNGYNDAAVAMDVLRTSNQLAASAMISTEEAASSLTAIMDVYVRRGETAVSISDKMTVAYQKSEKSYSEFNSIVEQLAPTADSLGISLTDLSSTIAFLTSNGVPAESAMSGLRQIMGSFLDPTKEAKKAAADLGIELSSQGIRAKGLSNTLIDLITKSKGSAEALSGMFTSMRELQPLLAISTADMGDFSKLLEDVGNSTGATARAFDEVSKSSSYQLGVLGKNLKNLALEFLLSLEKPLASALTAMNKFISVTLDFQVITANLKLFLAKYGEDLKALGITIGIVVGAYSAYVAIMKIATAVQIAFNAIVTANPYVIAIAGVVALGSAIFLLTKNVESTIYYFRTFQAFLTGTIIESLNSIIGAAISLADWLGIGVPESAREAMATLSEMSDQVAEEQTIRTQEHETRLAQKEAETNANVTALEKELAAKVANAEKEAALEDKKANDWYARQVKNNVLQNKIDKEATKNKIEIMAIEDLLNTGAAQAEERRSEEKIMNFKLAGNETYNFLVQNLGEKAALQAVYDAQELEAQDKHKEAVLSLEKKYNEAMTAEKKNAQIAWEKSSIGSIQKLAGYERNADTGKLEQKEKTLTEELGMTASFFGNMSSLMRVKNKEAFRIGQASAMAQAVVSAALSIIRCFEYGPILGPIFAAGVGVATAIQLAAIASQKPPAMQDGGIVPGNSYSGDRVMIRANSSEMVLNSRQQANLFNMANNGIMTTGGTSSEQINNLTDAINRQPIIVEIDGIQIAKAVRRSIQSGFVLQGV